MSKRNFDQMAGLPPMMASLLDTGKYGDLIIKCSKEVFNVHRNVVCVHSKPFAAMVDGPFLEATSGVIDLGDDDPEIIRLVLNFMYKGDYSDGRQPEGSTSQRLSTSRGSIDPGYLDLSSSDEFSKAVQAKRAKISTPAPKKGSTATEVPGTSQPAPSALIINAKVYASAEMWDIPALKTLAAKKYKEALPQVGFPEDFIDSLESMYNNLPENDLKLKVIALDFVGKHYKGLVKRDEFLNLCSKNGDVAVSVLKTIGADSAQTCTKSCCRTIKLSISVDPFEQLYKTLRAPSTAISPLSTLPESQELPDHKILG
ncbi:uncharacterized protein LY89DRAFT_747592 [Mollisia scopiformis]|uniref:BTB domain-containing protein n=1 Tax=Mollisia scopiformis TaxID=149040 RepID=A0A194XC54_MOLSC|nr:uncharacterized protein LY89DRAFT_747592 [Mollisia scopiformis]KUJ17753.1 hypothetical protein LY89DRAFT_747592 [Mollisia scopiformis]